MKKFSITYIFICLGIVYIMALYNLAYDVQEWLSTAQRSWTDFLFFKKEDLVSLLLIILSITGIIVREKKGWILTIQLFYSLLGASVTMLLIFSDSSRLLLFALMVIFLAPPIVMLHSADLKRYYKIEAPETMLLNNVVAIVIALLVSFLMW